MFSALIDFIRSLYGGQDIIALHEPVFIGSEKKYLIDCIDSTFVSSIGKYVDAFEEMLCETTGAKFAIATVNGTSALHAALMVGGVEPGSEVITQALSFVATANAIRYCGARPVFIDVDKDTLGMSPDALRRFLTNSCQLKSGEMVNRVSGRKIAACVPMHTLGHPCRIDQIVEICREYDIPVIEDAAESLGSYYKGRHTGTFGISGALSFNGNKIVTSGGGGAILTDDGDVATKLKHITTTAKVSHRFEYDHDMVGFNYRLPNINAALACAQLEKLELFVSKKRELASEYATYCDKIGIEFFSEIANAESNYWLNAIILDDGKTRDAFLNECLGCNIMVRPLWRLLSNLPMYKNEMNDGLEDSKWIAERVVNLPSGVRK